MSNREALRKLSRKVPSKPEIDAIMNGLSSEPDLATAITGAALAEAALENLLIGKFKHSSPNLIGQLFLNRGPLMDFHSKILVAQAFGVITSSMAEEFHSIKAIRNAFAHSKVPLGFDHEIIGREVTSMAMGAAIRKKTDSAHTLGNREWFLLTVRLLLIILDELQDSPHSADRALRLVLEKPDNPVEVA
ncbi:hypothetical protein [Mesorhizobium sp. M1403]|uniref:hypothetical protein n=1 Tax=Mesorhizobium sp. M1403 TaxID=2957097 RepID=UPI0033399119